ncbi:hypothetical protein BKA70DRAFT_1251891 [Coprinopsis sp. MPI-PUGE-AT-0042]|nr:hypothetical protein BKA70DRAFT_1251891 [Coprinopsis sp. MPI-PUGE-AT-0042]
MYLPILSRRMSAASDANGDCLNTFRSCSSPTTEESSTTSGNPDDSHWYIRDGPHRYMGAVMVGVMLFIVLAVYLYVGKTPRKVWKRLRERSLQRREPNTGLQVVLNKEKGDGSTTSPESYHHSPQSQSQTLEHKNHWDHRIAPEQIAWLPEKPQPCLKQKAGTVELEWSTPVARAERREEWRNRNQGHRSKRSSRHNRRSQIPPITR